MKEIDEILMKFVEILENVVPCCVTGSEGSNGVGREDGKPNDFRERENRGYRGGRRGRGRGRGGLRGGRSRGMSMGMASSNEILTNFDQKFLKKKQKSSSLFFEKALSNLPLLPLGGHREDFTDYQYFDYNPDQKSSFFTPYPGAYYYNNTFRPVEETTLKEYIKKQM